MKNFLYFILYITNNVGIDKLTMIILIILLFLIIILT